MPNVADRPSSVPALRSPPSLITSEAEIRELVDAFERGTLAGSAWNHRAHLTVALWYLTQYGAGGGGERVRAGIQRLNAANGVPQTPAGGYHETITGFYLWAVGRHLRDASPGASLVDLANTLIATWGDKNRPLEYDSRDRLFSWEARTGWVEPDLRPLE